MKGIRTRCIALAAAGAAVTAFEPARADDISGPTQRATIIVTADPLIQSSGAALAEAPQKFVIRGESLGASGPVHAQDLERVAPGLNVGNLTARGAPAFIMRGAGLNDNSTNAESPIGLYSDGVALPYSIMAGGQLFDLDRIEIDKGPQGFVSGRSETGGRISFKPAEPLSDFHSGVRLGLDRFGVADSEAYVTGTLGGAKARLSGRIRKSDEGYQKSASRPGDRLGAQDEAGVRGIVIWEKGTVSARLSAHWNEDRSENPSPAAIDGRWGEYAVAQPRPTPFDATQFFTAGDNQKADWSRDFIPKRKQAMRGFNARVSFRPEDGTEITSISALEFFDRDDRIDISGVPYADTRWRMRNSIRTMSEEIRVEKAWSAAKLTTGFYLARDDFSENALLGLSDSPFNSVLGVRELAIRSRQTADQISLFGASDFTLTPQLIGSLGGRLTHTAKTWRSCAYDSGDGSTAGAWNNLLTPFVIVPSGLPDPGRLSAGGCALYNDQPNETTFGTFAPFKAKMSDDGASWRAALNWRPNDRFLAFASIAEGFKSGGFNGVVTQTSSQSAPYRAERLLSYEAGFIAQWRDLWPRLKASAFFNDYRDKQVTAYTAAPVGNLPALANIPRSQVFGIEAEALVRLMRSLSLALNATYSESRIESFSQVDPLRSAFPDIVRLNAEGFPLPNVPRWQARGTAAYSTPIRDNLKLTIEAGLSYKSGSYATADRRNPLSDYLLADMQVTIASADDRITATVWGRNLTNEYYWTSAYVTNGVFARTAGEPAVIGASLAFRR